MDASLYAKSNKFIVTNDSNLSYTYKKIIMTNSNYFIKFSSKIVFILSLFMLFTLSCEKGEVKNEDKEYREIAWNHIGRPQQGIITNWENARIVKVTYQNQEAVSVTFNTDQDGLLGPIVVLIAVRNKAVIAIAPRY